MTEATARGVLQKKLFLEISQYLLENTCVGVSFYKVAGPQVSSCEYCKIFKNTYFEDLLTTATEMIEVKFDLRTSSRRRTTSNLLTFYFDVKFTFLKKQRFLK